MQAVKTRIEIIRQFVRGDIQVSKDLVLQCCSELEAIDEALSEVRAISPAAYDVLGHIKPPSSS